MATESPRDVEEDGRCCQRPSRYGFRSTPPHRHSFTPPGPNSAPGPLRAVACGGTSGRRSHSSSFEAVSDEVGRRGCIPVALPRSDGTTTFGYRRAVLGIAEREGPHVPEDRRVYGANPSRLALATRTPGSPGGSAPPAALADVPIRQSCGEGTSRVTTTTRESCERGSGRKKEGRTR